MRSNVFFPAVIVKNRGLPSVNGSRETVRKLCNLFMLYSGTVLPPPSLP